MSSSEESEEVQQPQTERRGSKRIKEATLNSEIADIIVQQLELVDKFFSKESHDEHAINEFSASLDEQLSLVTDKYADLETITDNKVSENTTNMFALFRNEVREKKTQLLKMVETYEVEKQLLADGEKQMEEAEQLYKEQLEKFHHLMARMKVHSDNTTRIMLVGTKQQDAAQLTTYQSDLPIEQQREKTTAQSSTQMSENNNGLDAVKELAKSLIVTMKTSKRTAPEPAVYDGNPIDFQDWEMDFDAFVESQGLTGKEPLRYLKRYVKDKAKEAISGHFITNTEKAYQDARKELKDRFGSQQNVNTALRDKLETWPKVGNKDSAALRGYADFLLHIKSAMADVPELESLSLSQENIKLTAKLPDWMIRLWAKKVKDTRKATGKYPNFDNFVEFVVDHAETEDEPLMKLVSSGSKEKTNRKSNKEAVSEKVRVFKADSTTEGCKYCSHAHATANCFSLAKEPEEKKQAFVKENRLCWACLLPGHRSRECASKAMCKICDKRHPTSLHMEPDEWKEKLRNSSNSDNSQKMSISKEDSLNETLPKEETKRINVKATGVKGEILSMVVPVHVSAGSSPYRETLVYALLDTQSDASYISSDAAKAIDTKYIEELVTMDTLVGESTSKIKKHQDIRIRGYGQTETTTIEAYEWDKLICSKQQIPNCINVKQYSHLKDHAHKLPPPLDIPVGMLIGANCPAAFAPLEAILGASGLPFAQKTMLGWTVFGGVKSTQSTANQSNSVKRVNKISTVLNDLDESSMVSQEDLKFLDIMEKGVHRNKYGLLEMPLPFRERPILPNNRIQAEKRLLGLQKKFRSDDDFKNEYHAFMESLFEKGHAELANEKSALGEAWYIPHFAVTHPKKGKLRIVFDCSAEFCGNSLNDHLLPGPDSINNLIGILLRFRKEPIALACDIEKMFYNFWVNAEDRDYLRFLWFAPDGSVKEYRMTVHLFGATSSPAVATYGLRSLAKSKIKEFYEAANFICRDFYVDDGITSVASVSEATKLITEACRICEEGKLRLHKFLSNSKEVLDSVPDSERCKEVVDLLNEALPTQRTLGLEWSADTDTLTFTDTGFQQKPPTRRGILSTVSQLYDPLGLLAPFTLIGKNILQKVNKCGADWDDDITEPIQNLWIAWKSELGDLNNLTIPRCIKPENFGKVIRTELHHFCDASNDGIGACSYIRLLNEQNQVHTSLLLAKSKVIPSKGIITIPRLELQAAVVATQLSEILRKELDMDIDQEWFWTDSKIVLAYLANEKRKFLVYVANRVREIKARTAIEQWHHVSSDENPADIASRGLGCSKLLQSMWFTGPTFLKDANLSDKLTQKQQIDLELDPGDPEVKKISVKTTKALPTIDLYQKIQKYSSIKTLETSFAYLKQFAAKKSWRSIEEPSVPQLSDARNLVIKITQKKHFETEVEALQNGKCVSQSSNILVLNPYLDEEGLIRVGGRANKSRVLNENEKHPIVIPKESHLAKLLILDSHEKAQHLGRAHTLNAVRQRGYWIIGGARLTKDVVGRCIPCKKSRGSTLQQQMGELPKDRLERAPPFAYTGMDCFGPFIVKDRRSELKRYGLLFTCMYSRAVHIETLDDLTSNSFINGLRCFLSVRGAVTRLHCDQGSNFIGGRNEFDKLLDTITKPNLKMYLTSRQIEFVTTTPTASHQGGIWERQIRSIRSILSQTVAKYPGRLDTTSLRVLFHEAAAIVNNRPLSIMNLNSHEQLPLTPNMILTGKIESTPPPPGEFNSDDAYCKSRWKRVQAMAEEFWKRWKIEYLDVITKRQVWKSPSENIKPGNVVLITEPDQPRNLWRIGMIEEVKPGQDGQVRNATVRLATKLIDGKGKPIEKATILHRPIQKLVKLM